MTWRLTGLELGDAEQVVGEPAEVLGLGAQLVEALLACLLGQMVAAVLHERQPRLDLGQRRAQLMRREHHELALDAVHLAQLREDGVLQLGGMVHLPGTRRHHLASQQ
jgi:hypothetical protein